MSVVRWWTSLLVRVNANRKHHFLKDFTSSSLKLFFSVFTVNVASVFHSNTESFHFIAFTTVFCCVSVWASLLI